MTLLLPAGAQDIRGLEVCTTEAKIELAGLDACRLMSCFFSKRMKLEGKSRGRSGSRDILLLTEMRLTALKLTVEKLKSELARLKARAETDGKK